jgi:hypothetical protein
MLPPKPAGGVMSLLPMPKTPTSADFEQARDQFWKTMETALADKHLNPAEVKQIGANVQTYLTLISNYLSDTWNKVPPEAQRALHQDFDRLFHDLSIATSVNEPQAQYGVLRDVQWMVTKEWLELDKLYPAPPELSPAQRLGQRMKEFGHKIADLFHEPKPAQPLDGAVAQNQPPPQQTDDKLWK